MEYKIVIKALEATNGRATLEATVNDKVHDPVLIRAESPERHGDTFTIDIGKDFEQQVIPTVKFMKKAAIAIGIMYLLSIITFTLSLLINKGYL